MALSSDDSALLGSLRESLENCARPDKLMSSYYEGEQLLETLGLAVPPDLQRFTTIVNWPALVVDSVAERITLRGFILPGSDLRDPGLQEGWEANNLDSDQTMLWNDKLVYGRGFLAVGSNEDDAEHPLITVESPRELTCQVDPRTRRVTAALKLYLSESAVQRKEMTPDLATLYLPDRTSWLSLNQGIWSEDGRDEHKLGRVPVVPFLNRRRTGRWSGESEMKRAISLTDAAARSLTNLQLAQETHAVPQRYVNAVSKGDFADQNGEPLPVWKAYFSGIWATESADAKFGQFSASDLRNFTETVTFYGGKIAGIYGLPPQYVGGQSDNPSSAEAIREGKEGLILRAERHMRADGDALGRTMALYMRFRDGEWPDGNRITADWYDPAYPTQNSLAASVVALHGAGLLSREGSWDRLGWSEAEKSRERDYFDQEASDPTLAAITAALTPAAQNAPAGG